MILPDWFLDPQNRADIVELRKKLHEVASAPGKPVDSITNEEFCQVFSNYMEPWRSQKELTREATAILTTFGWQSRQLREDVSVTNSGTYRVWRPPQPSPWKLVPNLLPFREAYETYTNHVWSPVSVQLVLGWCKRELVRSVRDDNNNLSVDLNGLMATHAAQFGEDDIWSWPEYQLKESVPPSPEECYEWDPDYMYEMVEEFCSQWDKIQIGHLMDYVGLDQETRKLLRNELQAALEGQGFIRPKLRHRWWVRQPPSVNRTLQERETTQKRILMLFDTHNTLTTREIMDLTGLTNSQVTKDVKVLVDQKKLGSFGRGSSRSLYRE